MNDDIYADAVWTVSCWDVDPDNFADTVNAYARLCAGQHLDEADLSLLPSAYCELQF